MAIGVECTAVNTAFDNLFSAPTLEGGIRTLERSPQGPFPEGQQITLIQSIVGAVPGFHSATSAAGNVTAAFRASRWTEVLSDPNTVHYTGPCSFTPPIDCDGVATFSTDNAGTTRMTATITATFTARSAAPTTTE